MTSNLDRFRKDLNALIERGQRLLYAFLNEHKPEELKNALGKHAPSVLKDLPSFAGGYQPWYSESMAVVRQVLPDRLADFVRHYQKPKQRKAITFENYVIEDALQGLTVTSPSRQRLAGPEAAIPQLQQQLGILKAVKGRFESSLFDIRQLLQADLFDSELEAARELLRKGFLRGAGAVAGVVLERHLTQVCDSHKVAITQKAPGLADLNDLLKKADVIDTPQWRSIQHLVDLRNLCDHSKAIEPTREQVNDLLNGVAKTIKTLF